MKPFLVVTTIAVFGATATVGVAQSGMATAPADRSTGPTFPGPAATDTRQIDQSMANAPAGSGRATTAPHLISEIGRSSSGLNADPDNSAGAPGLSTGVGTRGP
ncbi:MAG TPA: hypothetical protein VLA02_07560 [Reyranella sp.]|nr:hypothetical protein [Reyranella sp.]